MKDLLTFFGIGAGLVILSRWLSGQKLWGLGNADSGLFGLLSAMPAHRLRRCDGIGATHRRRRRSRRGRRKTSVAAQKYISKKIKKLRHEGYAGRQATAIAFSMARDRGYKVPAAPAA